MNSRISVIVPAYNAAASISVCLENILRSQDGNYEVIAVDDGSTDGTFQAMTAFPIRALRNPENRGAANARNQGARLAEGEILVFIDSDVMVRPDTLSRLRSALEQKAAAAVFGIYSARSPKSGIAATVKNLYCHYVNARSSGYVSQFSTCCGAVKKGVFDALGGFSERFARANMEDVDFGYRLAAAGFRSYLDASIQVEHQKEFSFGGLLANDFQRARMWTRLLAYERFCRRQPLLKDECNLSGEQAAALGLNSLTWALILLGFVSPWAWVAGAVSASAYGFVNRAFFTLIFQKMRLGPALLAVLQYSLSQVAAVVGLLAGLIEFSLRKR